MTKRSSRDTKASMDDVMGHVGCAVVVVVIAAAFYFMLQMAEEKQGTNDAVIPTEKRDLPSPPM